MDFDENLEKEAMNKLMITEEQKNAMVLSVADKLSNIFKITESGEVLFLDIQTLNEEQAILFLLIGKCFSARWKFIPSNLMKINGIARTLNRPRKLVSAKIKDLSAKGIIRKDFRGYYIPGLRLIEVARQVVEAQQ